MEDLLLKNDRMRLELEKILDDVYCCIYSDKAIANEFSWTLQTAWWGFHRNSVCLIRLFDKEGAFYPTSMIARFLMETVADISFAMSHGELEKLTVAFSKIKSLLTLDAIYKYIASDDFRCDVKLSKSTKSRIKEVFGKTGQENYASLCDSNHFNLFAIEMERRTAKAGEISRGWVLLPSYAVQLRIMIKSMIGSGFFPELEGFDFGRINKCFDDVCERLRCANRCTKAKIAGYA